jgi:intraflagellar transport protein 46
MDMTLQEYAKVCCAILDIPVHNSITQSLHVLFTLYSEFKNNPHFGNIGGNAGGSGGTGAASGTVGAAAGAGSNMMSFDDGESKS